MLEEDRGLALFLRNLEALGTILKERATIVIPADCQPFRLLREMPLLEPNMPARQQ